MIMHWIFNIVNNMKCCLEYPFLLKTERKMGHISETKCMHKHPKLFGGKNFVTMDLHFEHIH